MGNKSPMGQKKIARKAMNTPKGQRGGGHLAMAIKGDDSKAFWAIRKPKGALSPPIGAVLTIILLFALSSFLLSCKSVEKNPSDSLHFEPPQAPLVRPDSEDLLFQYHMDGGELLTTNRMDTIPERMRKEVMVVDLSISPEERRSDQYVVLVDLSEPPSAGNVYPARVVLRSHYEDQVRQRAGLSKAGHATESTQKNEVLQTDQGPHDPLLGEKQNRHQPTVIMYATSWCPACIKARKWLTKQGIRVIEKDIENDKAAAAELAKKAAEHGVRANSVPVFDIGGRLVVGFDQKVFRKMQ